jgi:hypothetical protein
MSTINDDGELGSVILDLELEMERMEQCRDQLGNVILELDHCEQCCATCKKKKAPDNEIELCKCRRCQVVYYCDIACQKKNWVEHKEFCNSIRKFRNITYSGLKELISYISNLNLSDP